MWTPQRLEKMGLGSWRSIIESKKKLARPKRFEFSTPKIRNLETVAHRQDLPDPNTRTPLPNSHSI
jgi:hypothetical protein